MLADARALMAQALTMLDIAEVWEAGAHLDAAIRGVDDVLNSPMVDVAETR